MTPPLAVLFDLDGTLVDTEPYWLAAERALVTSFGGTWTGAHAEALIGASLPAIAARLRANGVQLASSVIADRLHAEVLRECRRGIPWRPGARELIAALVADAVPCGLVTMSYRPLALVVSGALPRGSFATVVTGEEVELGKPDPAAYRLAAHRLGVSPTRCVAIEDSPTGVAAAEAAGCLVVAVPHHVPIEPVPGRLVVNSLADLTIAGRPDPMYSPLAVDRDLNRCFRWSLASANLGPLHQEARPWRA
jgi:HAD superfamily hydrolase (TIGR01509 family)